MVIQKEDLKGSWGLKLPIIILAIYFFLLYPFVQIFLRDHNGISQYAYPLYFFVVLVFIVGVRKFPLAELGVSNSNFKQNILLGGVCGGLVVLCLPLLNGLIDLTGMNELEVFRDKSEISQNLFGEEPDFLSLIVSVFLVPCVEQTFFSGIFAQVLLKKYKPVFVIYIVGIIFTLAHFKLDLGTFFIGLITAQFFYLTGTLLAPILFQALCRMAGVLLRIRYTRLVALLYFLF